MTESRMQGFAAGRYAAIDIGTVTCRMLVADVDAAGAIHEVDREYAITNLGEGVDATGMLLPAAIDRTALPSRAPPSPRPSRWPPRHRAMQGTPMSSCGVWRSSALSFRSYPVGRRRGCRSRVHRAISLVRTLWWWISVAVPLRWWWAVRAKRRRGRTPSISDVVASPRSSSAPILPHPPSLKQRANG